MTKPVWGTGEGAEEEETDVGTIQGLKMVELGT